MTTTTETARPGFVGRLRSRQAGHPSALLGRLVGRLMVNDTAETNDRALAKLDLTQPRTVLDVGFGQGRTVAVLVRAGHRVLEFAVQPVERTVVERGGGVGEEVWESTQQGGGLQLANYSVAVVG